MPSDFYEVLGVQKNADQDSIKKAYRKLAMQFHPDKNPGNSAAEEKFKEAAAAYEVLGDPEKRARYDRFGHAGVNGGFQGGGGGFQDVNDIFSAFGDIFGDIFGESMGTRGSRNRPSRGSHLRYVLEVSLKEVIEGTEKDVKFETEGTCEDCTGTGAEKGSKPEVCRECGGRGQVVRAQGFFSVAATCPSCRGQGEIISHPCKKCRGRGRVQTERRLKVKVPPGVDTGTQLRLAGEGEGGFRGGPAGDLFVEIRVAEDRRFTRHGTDLLGEVEISYLQALLGADLEVDTVKGKVNLEIPAGTQPGERIRVPGAGIPQLRGYGRGDLYFEVKVRFPKKLEKEEERTLREIAKMKDEPVKGVSGLFGKSKTPPGKKGPFFN